jgi:hypothetical protein
MSKHQCSIQKLIIMMPVMIGAKSGNRSGNIKSIVVIQGNAQEHKPASSKIMSRYVV